MKLLRTKQDIASIFAVLTCTNRIFYVDAGTPSASIDLPHLASTNHGEDLSSFLTFRNLENSPLLQRATIIFQTKLSDSSPLQDAALELLKTCKSAENLSTPSNSPDSIKDAAKFTYAIKATLISLATAGVHAPRTCRGFGSGSNKFTLLEAVNVNRWKHSVPSAGERSMCMRDLWKTDNSWTSYANGLQDANTLCQIPSLENAQRAILDLLSDMNDIIPAWLETLDQSQTAHLEFLRQQKLHTEHLDELQRRQREDLESNHEAVNSALTDLMATTKSHVDGLTLNLRQELFSAEIGLEQMRKAVNTYVLDFLILKDEHDQIFQAYQSKLSNAVAVQSRSLNEVEDTVKSVVKSLEHMHGGLYEQVFTFSTHFGAEMRGVLELQNEFKGSQEHLLIQQTETIQYQREISDFAMNLKSEIANMTTAVTLFQNAFGAIGGIWQGLQTFTGRAIASSLVLSFLLSILGFRLESAVSVCLGILTWLLPPVLQPAYEVLLTFTDAVGTTLAALGRHIFIFIVRALSSCIALTSNAIPYFNSSIDMIHIIVAAVVLFIVAGSFIFKLRTHKISPRNAERSPAKSRKRYVLEPNKQPSATQSDRFGRAATLPPQRKPVWAVEDQSEVASLQNF